MIKLFHLARYVYCRWAMEKVNPTSEFFLELVRWEWESNDYLKT